MAWRKWFVRGLVFSVLGALVLAVLLYQAWTNPTAIRRQVLAKLSERFVGAMVSAESAHLRLLGGISVSELRMTRRDDLDRNDFFYAPSAVIYYDKEQLLNGHLEIPKLELHRPRLRIIRERDGRLNLEGILGPLNLHERVPTIVFKQATLVFEDRSAVGAGSIVEIGDLNVTAINDPLPMLKLEGSGRSDVAGPMQFSACVQRADGAGTIAADLPAIPIGPTLVQRLIALFPREATHVRQLAGQGRLRATLVHEPGATRALSYDVSAELHRAEFSHPRLPIPLEQIEATARLTDGQLPLVRCTARSGATKVSFTAKHARLPTGPVHGIEDLVGELDATVEHLPVDDALFTHLPVEMKEIQSEYRPSGPLSFEHALRRDPSGNWRKHWTFRLEGMRGVFFKFPYPLEGVTGVIERETLPDRQHTLTVNLTGSAGGRTVRAMGKIEGEASREEVELDIWGDGVPLDHNLEQALPPRSRALAAQFSPTGQADFKAFIRRPRGTREFANRYHVRFRESAMTYRMFPYSLENVTGVLDIYPDHWECRDFRGTHKGGEFLVSGRSFPLSSEPRAGGERPQRVQVNIQGNNILLDEEFEAALAPPEAANRAPLKRAWNALALAGRLSFAAEVVDVPGQPQDIDVAVAVRGCTMRPKFFPYALDDVGGRVRYTRDRVWISDVKARHGASRLAFREGQVLLRPGSGFQARIAAMSGDPIVLDTDFLKALPPQLRKGLEPLKLHDPVSVRTDLVIDVPSDGGPPPTIWWDGTAALADATLRTGIDLSGVSGRIATRGRHNGTQLEGMAGHVLLQRATVLKQPLTNVTGRLEILGESPGVLRLRDLKADAHGGTVGGEARIEFGAGLHYDLVLQALGVRLEEFARHNLAPGANIEGAAQASLHLTGDATGVSGLRGNGRLDVPNGKLYRLPVLLDLLKAFNLRAPDRTAFEQATLVFHIDGPQLQIQQFDLYGNVVSLRGQGTANLDGTELNLDVHADPARIGQLLPAGLDELPRTLSDWLFKIKVTGRVGDVHYEKELVPAVTGPIKRALGER